MKPSESRNNDFSMEDYSGLEVYRGELANELIASIRNSRTQYQSKNTSSVNGVTSDSRSIKPNTNNAKQLR